MYELVVSILSAFMHAIDFKRLLHPEKAACRARMAKDMHTVYTSLTDIVARGRSLLEKLDSAIEGFEHHTSDQDPRYIRVWETHQLRPMLVLQAASIGNLIDSLVRAGGELKLLSTRAFTQLAPLLAAKHKLVWDLQAILGGGDLPTRVLVGEIGRRVRLAEALAGTSEGMEPDPDDRDWSIGWVTGMPIDLQERLSSAYQTIYLGAVKTPGELTRHNYPRLKEYLTSQRPEAAIETLETIAEELRERLLSTFSLDEMLPLPGDKPKPSGLF